MIRIAIDGPSGAGKSSLAKGLAAKLGINYLDTGALYRTVGYAAREAGIGPDDRGAVVKMLGNTKVRAAFEDGVQMMYLNGRPLGDAIRENDISAYASAVSAIPEVRAFLLETQRDIARRESVVMDGRDIGSCVLKDAVCSPGGTTIEAVAALEQHGFRNAVISAQRACSNKSKEMSKRES